MPEGGGKKMASLFFFSLPPTRKKPEWFLIYTTNPLKASNLQQPSTTADVSHSFLQDLRPASFCRRQRRQSSCYLQGPSWVVVDLSTCFLTVWLLFSGMGLTSDRGMLLAPSTDGADATWFSWSGSCLGASDALDECPALTNRQRHGSDLDDSGELGGLITMLCRGGGGAVCSLSVSGLSSSNEILQTGQVEFCSSHKSIQAMWKSWPQ
jgi:hypothetical protein